MDKEEIKDYVDAGEIARDVKWFAQELIEPGMKLIDIATAIDDKIEELGGEPAFPATLCVDEVAAHFTPDFNCELVAEGLLTVDFGVSIDGFIADTAFSLDLTEDKRHKEMIRLNEEILANVEKIVRFGAEVWEVGDSVQKTLMDWNSEHGTEFRVIKSLSGHELGQHVIHAGLTISNYKNENKTELGDRAVAIEPFVTTGVGDIYEGEPGGIYVLQSDEPVRDRDSREVLAFIKERYKTLPFCRRWLEKENFGKLGFVLSDLVKKEILHHYPMLIEKSKKPVSQFENTFLVLKEGVVVSTK